MAVSFDASNFKRRIVNLRNVWIKTNVPGSIASLSAEDIATQIRNKYRNGALRKYQWETQVGITRESFITATAEIGKIGEAEYGALNLRAMGDERDIAKIKGVPELWHMGSGKKVPTNSKGVPFADGLTGFEAFRSKILGNYNAKAYLFALRESYWGNKVPQWIYLEWGDTGGEGRPEGTVTGPALALYFAKDPKYVFQRWTALVRQMLQNRKV